MQASRLRDRGSRCVETHCGHRQSHDVELTIDINTGNKPETPLSDEVGGKWHIVIFPGRRVAS